MNTRVLVLGSTGMLGVALCHRLQEMNMTVLTLERTMFDARQPDFSLVLASRAEVVVNAIGLINRRLDRPESDFFLVNSLFPHRLADYCERHQMPCVHVSTDCVFRGDPLDGAPYDESAVAMAGDLYGKSKFWGEPANALVLRTSIIGPERFNHYALLCWFMMQSGVVPGFVNHLWNGLTTDELARVIGTIIQRNLAIPGIRHVHGEDLTKYMLLGMIRDAFGSGQQVQPVEDTQARDTRLCTRYPEFLAALAVVPMREQLARLRTLADDSGHWSPR